MRLPVILASTFGFVFAAQACPEAPRRPAGWKVDLFKDDDSGPRSTLFGTPPLETFTVRPGPVQFGSLPNARNRAELSQLVFQGTFRACQAGSYDFQLIMEAAPNEWGRGLLCVGELREGQSTIFAINDRNAMWKTEQASASTRTGSANLPQGLYSLRFRITCGTQFYGNSGGTSMTTPDDYLWRSGFALRVKGPGDSQYRDFRSDEIFQAE
jgi:hypothetical protein